MTVDKTQRLSEDRINQYLSHDLSDQEAADLELYFFHHPDALVEVEATRMLRNELRRGKSPVVSRADSDPALVWRVLTSRFWALGTTVGLAVLGSYLVFLTASRGPAPLPIGAEIRLMNTRSADTLIVPRGESILMTIDPQQIHEPSRVVLTLGSSAKPIFEIGSPPVADGFVLIQIPSGLLASGEYVAQINGRDSETATVSYRFLLEVKTLD